jgi:hypothetical protein
MDVLTTDAFRSTMQCCGAAILFAALLIVGVSPSQARGSGLKLLRRLLSRVWIG